MIEATLRRLTRANYFCLLLASSFGFLIAGMFTRLHLRHIESRLQIAAFWIIAIAFQIIVHRSLKVRPGKFAIFVSGVSATIGIVAIKWLIEGPPPLSRWAEMLF